MVVRAGYKNCKIGIWRAFSHEYACTALVLIPAWRNAGLDHLTVEMGRTGPVL